MHVSLRLTALSCACLAGALTLSACGKHDSGETTPASASTAPAAATTAASATTASAKPATSSTAAKPVAAATTAAPASTPASAGTSNHASATPAASQPISVASVTLGSAVTAEHKVSKAKTRFASNERTIYASVVTSGDSTAPYTLSAKWSYEDNGKPTTVNTTSVSIDSGAAVTAFKLSNPNAWPEGKYSVQISLDGKPAGSQDFEIRKG